MQRAGRWIASALLWLARVIDRLPLVGRRRRRGRSAADLHRGCDESVALVPAGCTRALRDGRVVAVGRVFETGLLWPPRWPAWGRPAAARWWLGLAVRVSASRADGGRRPSLFEHAVRRAEGPCAGEAARVLSRSEAPPRAARARRPHALLCAALSSAEADPPPAGPVDVSAFINERADSFTEQVVGAGAPLTVGELVECMAALGALAPPPPPGARHTLSVLRHDLSEATLGPDDAVVL